MNNSLLDRLSPRPACPLVRLGRTTPLQNRDARGRDRGRERDRNRDRDSQQPSSSGSQNDDPEDYYMHNLDKRNLELYTRNINDRFFDYKDTSFQNSSASVSASVTSISAAHPRPGGATNYYNRPAGPGPLTSLSLSAGLAYWEGCKSMHSSDSSQECSERMRRPRKHNNFTPNAASKANKVVNIVHNSDSDYLMDSFLKLGKNSPNQDQGYHTLVTPSPGCSTPNIWDRCETQLYRGKSRFHPSTRNNSFDRLQDDLVLRVFAMLNSFELSVLARVCRRFDRLVWRPELWRTITLAGETLSGDRAVRAVLRQLCGQGTTGACTQVERVHITDGAKITDKGVTLLARRCPEITHLQVTQTGGVTNASLNEIVNRCGNLQHLDVTGCVQVTCLINMMGPDPAKRLQLQYLDLTDCAALQDNGLRIIVRNCPLLAYLYLRRCTDITDAGLKFVPSFCSGLRELSVSDCTNITDFGLYELAKLGATLRYLSVAKCDQVSDAGLKVVARRCYKLRYLNVRGCEAVSDDAITVLARSCTRLRALDIGKCDVSDAGLRALAESCPNLKKLSLRNCDLVTDRGVQAIAYYCRGLQQLNIQDCQISLDGYRAVKKYCKRCIIEHTNPGFF